MEIKDIDIKLKVCPQCNELKNINYFGIDRSRNDGHMSRCKDCKGSKCDICGALLSSNTKMLKHKMSVHNNIRPYGCPHCSFKSSTNYNLINHIRRRHSKK